MALAKKMYAEKGGKPSVVGFDPDLPGSAFIWFTAFGGRTNDETGKPALDDPKNVEALTWLKQLMDAQGGYAPIKSFKDSMDTFGDKNQYVQNQVGVQTWAQWYVNVLAGTQNDISVAAVPIKTLEGKSLAMASGTAFVIPDRRQEPLRRLCLDDQRHLRGGLDGRRRGAGQDRPGRRRASTPVCSPDPRSADEAVRAQFVKPSGNADFDQMIKTYYEILPGNVTRGSSAVGTTDRPGHRQRGLRGVDGREAARSRRWPTRRHPRCGPGISPRPVSAKWRG